MTTPYDVWDAKCPKSESRGMYIAISGNTAAGKSSLIAELETRMRARGVAAIGISERVFHHPYLPLMFADSDDFAFGIQVSFMLERHLVLLRNLVQLGRTVLIERSHFDDELFVREHVGSGAITADQARAYRGLMEVLHARIPSPDILVLMNPAVETSMRRLVEAEERGDRPREFPSEETKRRWVERWHGLYVDLHERFRAEARPGGVLSSTTVIEAIAEDHLVSTADTVMDAWEARQPQ